MYLSVFCNDKNINSYVPLLQQHLNIMRSTYELQTYKDRGLQFVFDRIIFRCCWMMVIELQFYKEILKLINYLESDFC